MSEGHWQRYVRSPALEKQGRLQGWSKRYWQSSVHIVYLRSIGWLYCGVFTHLYKWVEFYTFATDYSPQAPFLLTSPQQMDLAFSGLSIGDLLACLRPLDLIYPKET